MTHSARVLPPALAPICPACALELEVIDVRRLRCTACEVQYLHQFGFLTEERSAISVGGAGSRG